MPMAEPGNMFVGQSSPILSRATRGFFTNQAIIAHYKTHIRNLLERVNTFDGIRYADHPAVLAWELLNEPRGKGLDQDGETLRVMG